MSYERLRWRKVARLESPLRESGAGRACTPRSVALIIKRGLFAVTSFSLMPRSRGSGMGRARIGVARQTGGGRDGACGSTYYAVDESSRWGS